MGWPFGPATSRAAHITARDLLGFRTADRAIASRSVTREQALRHSAVWACLRLRADLVSTMPVDVYRKVAGVQVEVPKPPVLIAPGGEQVDALEWMYSTQFDLDSSGNTFGIISARDGNKLPAQIDLVPLSDVTVQVRDGQTRYRIANKTYEPDQVWHEKQFTSSGLPVGLSPVAYAAASIYGYLSAQQFAADWFNGQAMPQSILKNSARIIDADDAQKMKDRFKASITNGDVFVTGKDWDYKPIEAQASTMQFLDERKFGIGDVCRFLGVPGDMIDAESSKGSITYANVTQRNMQLLIMNLGPAIARREAALSNVVARPRFVKLNTAALLRMDLKSRYESYQTAITNRFLAPSEVRELENRAPFTPEQEAEFDRLFGKKSQDPPKTGVPAS